jgi:hypothetical protein
VKRRFAFLVAVTVPLLPSPALACILCSGNSQNLSTFRQNIAQARLVLYGTLANARLSGDDANGGLTDFHIEKVLKTDPILDGRRMIVLPRYLPADPGSPPRFLVFCDVYKDKEGKAALDPFRGIPIKSKALLDYLIGIMKLDPSDRASALLYFFKFLDHSDETIAADAYAEFARATDQEIGRVAGKLSAARLRRWILDPQTPGARLGLYAFLLGGCGGKADAALLRGCLEKPDERTGPVLDGFLCGYVELRPKEGWDLAAAILSDSRRPFLERYAVLRALTFFKGWKPQETRRDILRCAAVVIPQGELADVAIEDLRRWQWWDLMDDVIAQYPKKSHAAPIVRRAIVRYALSCPRPEAARFIGELRRTDPELVKDVEETLQFDKK